MGLYLFLNEGRQRHRRRPGRVPTPGAHPYTNARLGVDGFVIDRLSLGGSLAIWAYDSANHGGGANRAS